ncbi:MAG: replication-associated recombination protein A [Elusimicrobiota bacterium]
MSGLTIKLIPKNIEEFVGQKHLVGKGKFLRKALEKGIIKSCLFYGPSGSGKTVLANIIAKTLNAKVFMLNATTSSVSDFKKIVDYSRSMFEKQPVLVILDEIHHFNKTQQDVLLPSIEKEEIILIGITTENPFFYINKALLSRFLIFEFKKHSREDLLNIIKIAIQKGYEGKLSITERAKEVLVNFADGDARKLLNFIEALEVISKNGVIDEDCIKDLLSNRYSEYDKKDDKHYDTISAFIKSMRGSDPDATIYWLAKMIYSGEDPLFIARRIVIAASEDVGLANPSALLVAQSAFEAVKNIGMPEARIILSEAALYVALSPKSNSAYIAIDSALDEVKNGKAREVPIHLRDAHLDGDVFGDGKGYKYPHDYPQHFVKQEYMPDHKKFYNPTDQGYEKEIKNRIERLWGKK